MMQYFLKEGAFYFAVNDLNQTTGVFVDFKITPPSSVQVISKYHYYTLCNLLILILIV